MKSRLAERARRTGGELPPCPDVALLLESITAELKSEVLSQIVARQLDMAKKGHPNLDAATVTQKAFEDFEEIWKNPSSRLTIVPGKEVLARLNTRLQASISISVSDVQVASQFSIDEIPEDLRNLLNALEVFRSTAIDGD